MLILDSQLFVLYHQINTLFYINFCEIRYIYSASRTYTRFFFLGLYNNMHIFRPTRE